MLVESVILFRHPYSESERGELLSLSQRSYQRFFCSDYQTVTKNSLIDVSLTFLFFFKVLFFNNIEPEFPFPTWLTASGFGGV